MEAQSHEWIRDARLSVLDSVSLYHTWGYMSSKKCDIAMKMGLKTRFSASRVPNSPRVRNSGQRVYFIMTAGMYWTERGASGRRTKTPPEVAA